MSADTSANCILLCIFVLRTSTSRCNVAARLLLVISPYLLLSLKLLQVPPQVLFVQHGWAPSATAAAAAAAALRVGSHDWTTNIARYKSLMGRYMVETEVTREDDNFIQE